MYVVLAIFHADLQGADAVQILLGKRAVQQVQAQYAVAVGGHFIHLPAGGDLHRAFAPGQARILHALVALDFIDTRQVLLRTPVGLHVHERVDAVDAVAQPIVGHAGRQVAEGEDIRHVGARAGHQSDRAQRHLIEFAPGLVGGVAVVTTGDFEFGDLEGLLLVNANPALRQLQHFGFAYIDLQAVVE